MSCQVCLCEQVECGEGILVEKRYMLPCHCQLLLCDKCVRQIDACLYHRQATPRPTSHTALDMSAIMFERDLLLTENSFLRKCLHVFSSTTCFVFIVNASAYVVGGVQCGVFVSFFIAVSACVLIHVYGLDLSPPLQAILIAWCLAVFLIVLVWLFNKAPL